MSRKRSHAALEAYRTRFVAGALEKGVEEELAHTVYDKLVAFSGFGFPKSHSAAFGLLAYQSAWLRHHYAAEFLAALLNAQPMGFYPPATLVRDGQRRGVGVLQPDVVRSAAHCRLENGHVRIGLNYVQGLSADAAEALVEERDESGNYTSVRDLAQRVALRNDELQALIEPARATASACNAASSSGSSASCRALRACRARAGRSASSRCRSSRRSRRRRCRSRPCGSGCSPTTARRASPSACTRSS